MGTRIEIDAVATGGAQPGYAIGANFGRVVHRARIVLVEGRVDRQARLAHHRGDRNLRRGPRSRAASG